MTGAAQADAAVAAQYAACREATDNAVGTAEKYLRNVEMRGADVAAPDTTPFSAFGAAYRDDGVRAWSRFLVRTVDGFEPTTVFGQLGYQTFLTELCTGPFPMAELTQPAQGVCADR